MRDTLRRCRFTPYRKGDGPTFTLELFETARMLEHYYGLRARLGYSLTMHEGATRTVLFEGEDFGASPMHAIDSDDTVRALMGFLTLRPGDTDADYFKDYTDAQRAYCDAHAESLAACNWRGKMLTGE